MQSIPDSDFSTIGCIELTAQTHPAISYASLLDTIHGFMMEHSVSF